MMTLLLILTFMIMVPAFGVLIIYSLNLYFLIFVAWQRRRSAIRNHGTTDYPFVTVQIPLYNERYVSQRIIDAVVAFDWPRDRFEIQVLDDSTDDTRQIVDEHVQMWRAQGVNIQAVRREQRVGYKAGALSNALPLAAGDYIAIFDADFIPPANFLIETVPVLARHPEAAFIQTRWDHLNRKDSWLTQLQAIALDGHFAIEQFARCYGGFGFNFNGTAGVWRKQAIEDAGGWQANTLTEDLDLSYRAWLKGWRALYRRDLTSPAELPPSMTAFRRQQARWAQGGVECARSLLPDVWRSSHTPLAKIQATMHMLGYFMSTAMVALLLSYPLLILVMRQYPTSVAVLTIAALLGPVTAAPTVFFVMGQLLLRPFEWRLVLVVPLSQVIGAGMVMNTLRATIKGLIGQQGEFLRTPKYGVGTASRLDNSYRVKADVSVMIDFMWGLYCLVVALLGILYGHAFITTYALMACAGSWWVALWTLWPDIRAMRGARMPMPDSGGSSS